MQLSKFAVEFLTNSIIMSSKKSIQGDSRQIIWRELIILDEMWPKRVVAFKKDKVTSKRELYYGETVRWLVKKSMKI